MIISCEKCHKKFELDANLIPDNGRLLKCGACSYEWHYIPENKIELVNEVKEDKIIKDLKTKIKKKEKYIEPKIVKPANNKKNIGIFSFFIASIISLIALIILIDTFKSQLSYFIPNIGHYILSLTETLRDIFLFFKDLIK